ncbi:MAG: acyl-CoA dehydrogenase [Rhodospirillaceae bacterium]|jgi:(2S)-methylsuccinyl-CoA dehydrogenase|nr:acyl-CoA dehydrogenase [Rhodospirillaceae bacterium]MBT5660358.1 acyl-CoA dehydrogenase [Rhodospirillaceae bacterium]MBT5752281.1 acyl-CoA dehydrogenase [Rhodospirillaceae bacterium]
MSDSQSEGGSLVLPDLLEVCGSALKAAQDLGEAAHGAVKALVVKDDGKIDASALEADQFAVHGLAWFETYVAALREMLAWAERLEADGALGDLESLILQAAYGEYLSQMLGGLPMSQVEILRPIDLGIPVQALIGFAGTSAVMTLSGKGNTASVREAIAEHITHGNYGQTALGDEMLDMVRDQFHRFTEEQILPNAHEWHLKDEFIPMSIIEQMAELGVFGLAIPEENGGLGMGKVAMCVVTEELSRGYLSVGSLGTRAEIAAELIRLGGTEEQKAEWLPKIASGEILTTAVFTEPNTGSDLASLSTRAVKDGESYKLTGAKTWITHGARSDLMTVLARTNPEEKGYKGLSMFLAEKPRGDDANPFPAQGMSGGEIEVLGYRGMKEYEIAFDGFEVPVDNLLGGKEGQGFKQLMATFESARIQTAARAVGVAQSAMEIGMKYAHERVQFGKPLYAFPRISGKLAWMAVETMIVRQLTYFSAREKDSERRCDIEAGMAKLLAARVAWSNADNALQIHGGNGYALEYPVSRVLCDARILNIFEGAAEIQAQVIARGLLSRRD